ncbi:MAG: DNA polymerase III subunit gamma and tau [Actinomycetaceae bacterium]|nr:DNA polymerase III subunit gamma and tau [Actinomycetaceae bacterium]
MSIAIYRRYRPQTFQEVIGQDHVVSPLRAALAAGRTTHAYLFSGPRGCGKTTSARILARCLNCVEYPTDTPCGKCESCVELARDGSGSLDVVELDAASHGGVDDARELREQAGFAPVRDRYKIYIIDEAHMVSNQGFNALLKLVEEPPEHVKFIFATTEPEKVIGTIRSRTHHYPFRLVPPQDLENYLAHLCEVEGVTAGKDVLSLVVRAGTGSVRDTLSVLDQIIGGSEGKTLDYDRAVALLGYTSAALLDEATTAIATRDGAALFGVVDSVVKSGHDPRRFVEDLLQRLRDLVILSLAGEAALDVFVSVPQDQLERMQVQAEQLGAARASRCADLTNEALTMMVGATAPRLQLELLCARLIVAQAPQRVAGAGVASSGGVGSVEGGQVSTPPPSMNKWRKPTAQEIAAAKHGRQSPPPSVPKPPVPVGESAVPVAPEVCAEQGVPAGSDALGGQGAFAEQGVSAGRDVSAGPGARVEQDASPEQQDVRRTETPPAPQTARRKPTPPEATDMPDSARAQARVATATPADAQLKKIADAWEQILGRGELGAVVRGQLASGARPVEVRDGVLAIAFDMPGLVNAFNGRGSGARVSAAIEQVLGLQLQVHAVPKGAGGGPKDKAAPDAATPEPPVVQSSEPEPTPEEVAREPIEVTREPIEQTQTHTAVPEPVTSASVVAEPVSTEPSPTEPSPTEPSPTESVSKEPAVPSFVEEILAAPSFADLPPLPVEPADGLSEVVEPEKDPVYGITTADEHADPAGVLGPLVDGTAIIIGEDNTQTAAQYQESEATLADYAEPVLELPGEQAFPPVPEHKPTPNGQPTTSVPPVPAMPHMPSTPPASSPTSGVVGTGRQTSDSPWKINVPPKKKVTRKHESDWDDVSMDDPSISESNLVGIKVLIERFDGRVIDEIPNER